MSTTRRLTSTVWRGYTINRPAEGGAPTATCLECGLTLSAGSHNGTSHLRRHSNSKGCQQRAAERAELCAGSRSTSPTATAAAAAAASPAGDDDVYYSPLLLAVVVVEDEEEKDGCFTVDGIYIPELYDKLIAEGALENIDQSRESTEHFSASSNYVPAQAPSSSTTWFINKTKERKKAENKKRCAPEPDDESGLHVSAQPDLNLRGKIHAHPNPMMCMQQAARFGSASEMARG